jgi:hypothetical protein
MKNKLLLLLMCINSLLGMEMESVSHEDLTSFAEKNGCNPSDIIPEMADGLTFSYQRPEQLQVLIYHPSKEWIEAYQHAFIMNGKEIIGHLPFRSKSLGCIKIAPGYEATKILTCLNLIRMLKGKKI